MRVPFRELPGERLILRPILPAVVERLEHAPLDCLLDTGALHNRFPIGMAKAAGVGLGGAPPERIAVGGIVTTARTARVDLTIGGETYDAPVWFCDPWPFEFGLLGLEGFFRYFRVTICAAEGWLDVDPEPVFTR